MRITPTLIVLTMLAPLILAPARNAAACSCVPGGPPCQNAFQVDAVFAGTVRSISAVPDDVPAAGPGALHFPEAVRVEFTEVVAFRSVQSPTVTVITAGNGTGCGYSFKRGERYLVYANRGVNGLVTGICSRTRLLAEAEEDLRFLQTLSAPGGAGGRIYGTVTHSEPDLATGEWRRYGPVPDVLVTVRGPGTAFEAWTDARGRYEVTVPPGKYDVAAVPAMHFSARSLRQSIDLRDTRACFVVDFGVLFNGRIKGVVRQASGEPATGIAVELMAAAPVRRTGYVQTLGASSDAGGSFEFDDVPPGRYVVGVELNRGMKGDVVYPRTFHPGTTDPALATVVELGGGQQRELEPMTLPPPRRALQLTGTVVFEDGTPASGVFISLADGAATWRQVAAGIKTDSDGGFSFTVHEGLSYIARASQWDEARQTSAGGSVGPFIVTQDTAPLRVVLSAGR